MNSNWERDLKRAVQSGMNDIARDIQRALDRVYQQYNGQPTARIKPALKRALTRVDVKLSENELTDYAQAISDGTRIKISA